MEPKIQQFLLKLPENKRAIATAIRDIMLSSHKDMKEAIKWNQLTFVYGKTNIAFIYTLSSKDYMNLGFMKAVHLTDPKKLFEGTGKGMRHIKIADAKKIPAAQIKKWAKEAISFEE
ncbi:MAG: DUF1801 domain-containing protein [Bacteroidia bacterium]